MLVLAIVALAGTTLAGCTNAPTARTSEADLVDVTGNLQWTAHPNDRVQKAVRILIVAQGTEPTELRIEDFSLVFANGTTLEARLGWAEPVEFAPDGWGEHVAGEATGDSKNFPVVAPPGTALRVTVDFWIRGTTEIPEEPVRVEWRGQVPEPEQYKLPPAASRLR